MIPPLGIFVGVTPQIFHWGVYYLLMSYIASRLGIPKYYFENRF